VSRFGVNRLSIGLDAPALAVDPAGNAILAWSEEVNGSFVIRASRWDAGAASPAWGPPEDISGTTHAFAIFPDIGIDGAGNAVVVWQAGNTELFEQGDVAEIWANRYAAP
jgi:hypothetical protein